MHLEDYSEEQPQLELCPICDAAMSNEEYEKNRGLCDSCVDTMKRRILYGEE
jgi:hypothetical protein